MQEETLSLLLFIDTGGEILLKIGKNVCAAYEERTRGEGVRYLQWICVDQLGHTSPRKFHTQQDQLRSGCGSQHPERPGKHLMFSL